MSLLNEAEQKTHTYGLIEFNGTWLESSRGERQKTIFVS